MTVEESERMFREEAFTDVGTARQQAARGTYDPAYLNYTMGKLMIRKLRDDWSASRGGRQAWRQFHDRFLTYGGRRFRWSGSRCWGERARCSKSFGTVRSFEVVPDVRPSSNLLRADVLRGFQETLAEHRPHGE